MKTQPNTYKLRPRIRRSFGKKSTTHKMEDSAKAMSDVRPCAIHAPYMDLASAVSSLPVSEPPCLTCPKQPPAHTPRHDLLVQSLWRPLRFNVAYMPTLNVRTNRQSRGVGMLGSRQWFRRTPAQE